MRKKVFVLSLVLASGTAFADGSVASAHSAVAANQSFQDFDNQYYLGYGLSYGNLTNAYGQNSNYGTNYLALGVERLFDMGLWLRFDATMMTGYSNFNSTNPNAATGPLGQNPDVATLNLKVGYALQPLADKLQLTPYFVVGRNTNLTSNSIQNNQSSSGGIQNLSANVTQDYFMSGGLGGRLEYRLNKVALFYLDQSAIYNYDTSQPTQNRQSASNYQLTTSLGTKVNIWNSLQLGVNAFYNYNQLSGAMANSQQFQLYPQNQIGVMGSIGLTY